MIPFLSTLLAITTKSLKGTRGCNFAFYKKDFINVNGYNEDIVGWGSQCIGTDAGQAGGMDPPFPAHNLLHKNNCFGLASLANLDKLPAKGAILIAAPLKIERGTGSPIRALALVPK
mgnify:CR=1 FL=1